MRRSFPLMVALCGTALACASVPQVAPLQVQSLKPRAGERVIVDQAVYLIDSSGSIDGGAQFAQERALFQTLVAGMPDGKYESGGISFGGVNRETHPLSSFDRSALQGYAGGLSYLNEGTPIHTVISEARSELGDSRGRAAIVLLSDGRPSDIGGREIPDSVPLDAAREAVASYDGKLCIHTVQIGNDPAGAAFLKQLSDVSGCGVNVAQSQLASAAGVESFERAVFLGGAAPVAKKMPGDRDGDGVLDPDDRCPNTLRGAKVDSRGCWRIQGLYFATNSDVIDPASKIRMDKEVVPVLKANPGVTMSIDGHTDARGAAAYNQNLSERRAKAVRDFLVSRGIDGDKLKWRGLGETQPAAPNDTKENMRLNRRTELTVVR
ncbi:MAG: OmpA family protein [Myxococcota bacterium]